jgi:nickel-dependent lactate racemase
MNIQLAYGKSGVNVDIPDGNLAGVLTMRKTPPLPDPLGALRAALLEPISSVPLARLASGAETACVVICDITRPVPNSMLLPPILSTIEASGVPRTGITILVATGLHRPSTEEELRTMVGEEVRASYRILDHHARVAEEQVRLGTTRRGTPVDIDRTYVHADVKVTTGFIEPHLMAGFSGGRKLIAPGCAGESTIRALHSPSFLEDVRCREGSIDGNPLHEELLEIAGMAGHDFIVNVSLNETHAVTGIFAGHPHAAHVAGIAHVRSSVGASLREPADIVITSGAGYPLDLTYYQAVKGVTAALPVVRKGGTLIVAAECAEGLGSPEFTTMATRYPDVGSFMSDILSRPVTIDQWQLEECAKAVRHADVILVSRRVHQEYAGKLFVGTAPSIEEALGEGFRKHGKRASVAVIPKGPYTLVSIDAAGVA